jgi:TonB family protein
MDREHAMNALPLPASGGSSRGWVSRVVRAGLRLLGAGAVAGALVGFLVLVRLMESSAPDRTIRRMETVEAVALPAPPPPPPPETDTPPPPPPPALPRLEVRLDSPAPAVKAVVDRSLDLTMVTAEFALESVPVPTAPVSVPPSPKSPGVPGPGPSAPRPAVKSSYAVGELDGKPQLLNRPDVAYPSALLRQGIREGRATVEIAISTSGSVSVRSLVSCSHPEFAAMARSFASRARFTIPRKNGQPVTAIYRWQLILRP